MSQSNPSDPKPSVSGQDVAGRRNRRLAIICAVVFVGMIAAAYAAVPLYRMFCQVTGFNGAVRKAEAAPTQVLDKTVEIRFDANVRKLPWKFEAEQTSQVVKIGATNLAFYRVTNTGSQPMTARAAYNVVPEQAGAYFQKLECFCFKDQTVQPGQTVEFPVVYFVDPRFATDRETKDQPTITLSYTFFPATDAPAQDTNASSETTKGANALGGSRSREL